MIKKIIVSLTVLLITMSVTTCIFITNTHIDPIMFSGTEEDRTDVWYSDLMQRLYDTSGEAAPANDSDAQLIEEEELYEPPPEHEGLEDLREDINTYINTRRGDWGVYVKNLKTNEYLSINEREYSSASLIKLFTMAAVYNELAAGTIEMNDDIKYYLEHMICKSDNYACNYFTRLLGGGNAVRGFDVENANTTAMGCVNTTHNSEIVDGRGRITTRGINRTSPRDCGIVLEKIYFGTLVSEEASASMLDLLLNQTRTWKIPASLPEGTVTANKTGETDTANSDAAIVYSPGCDYIICVVGNGNIATGIDTIHSVSGKTYEYFNPNT